MSPALSVYINALRLLAAITVLIGHATQGHISGALFWRVHFYGQDAVVVFFVLSGFVIAYVTDRREIDAATYALHRAARIYSVAIPALILTFAADTITCHVPSAAPRPWECVGYLDHAATAFPLSLAFLGEVWNLSIKPGTNFPYWSLGFEVPYYVMFGVFHFAPRPWNRIAAALLLIAAGPKIAAMFPVWLIGFATYRLCTRLPTDRPKAGLALWLAATITLAATAGADHGIMYEPFHLNTEQLRANLYYLALGALVAAGIIGLHLASTALSPLAKSAAHPINWLAGATFSIYLFHMPLLHLAATLSPWSPASWPNRALIYIAVPVIILALAEVSERRKDAWRGGLMAVASKAKGALPPWTPH